MLPSRIKIRADPTDTKATEVKSGIFVAFAPPLFGALNLVGVFGFTVLLTETPQFNAAEL